MTLTFINVTPLFEDAVEDGVLVTKTLCQNCGALTSSRRFPSNTTMEQRQQWQDADAERFLIHLDSHYPEYGTEN